MKKLLLKQKCKCHWWNCAYTVNQCTGCNLINAIHWCSKSTCRNTYPGPSQKRTFCCELLKQIKGGIFNYCLPDKILNLKTHTYSQTILLGILLKQSTKFKVTIFLSYYSHDITSLERDQEWHHFPHELGGLERPEWDNIHFNLLWF